MNLTTTVASPAKEAARLREALKLNIDSARIAVVLSDTIEQWRERMNDHRRCTVAAIAARTRFSEPLVDASLDALLEPFSADAIVRAAVSVEPRLGVAGFIIAGNVAGAGIHEVVLALLAGRAIVIKTASSEPAFFPAFAATLADVGADVAARLTVLNWSRDDRGCSVELAASVDMLVAYGDDSTMAAIPKPPQFVGFGSRVSGAIIALAGIEDAKRNQLAAKIARDATLYEQLGCLSPHHVFVVGASPGIVRDFARAISIELARLATILPPPRSLDLQDAAAVRRVREIARWRALSGEPVELHEGPRLDWTVVFDRDARFTISPGYRTLFVSAVATPRDAEERFDAVAPFIESLAIAGTEPMLKEIRALAERLGVSRMAVAGAMQSPPLDWRHGGGKFLELIGPRR
jgi:hypothetical protein